ncbi:MAG TPA: TIM barrel protein, partial [Dehalococcoidia bacterium]|nr:TIM barrel protein [Dehalococcoidia bacterium]
LPKLKEIVDEFSDLTFDLAMAYPCLTRSANPEDEVFQAGLAAAKLVGRDRPHLRVVDSARFPAAWESADQLPAAALSLADLAREAASQGVIFSIENSGQPIRSMALVVRQARAKLSPKEGSYLGLCPDPTNQLRGYPNSDPLAELEALPLDMVKLVHFKQATAGKAHPALDAGDLDCARMVAVLKTKGYQGPAIMEIPPHDQVLDNLSASFRYFGALAGGD